MSNRARLSQTPFTPRGGVDLDSIAERLDQHDSDIEAVGLDFDSPPDHRSVLRVPARNVARFPL